MYGAESKHLGMKRCGIFRLLPSWNCLNKSCIKCGWIFHPS